MSPAGPPASKEMGQDQREIRLLVQAHWGILESRCTHSHSPTEPFGGGRGQVWKLCVWGSGRVEGACFSYRFLSSDPSPLPLALLQAVVCPLSLPSGLSQEESSLPHILLLCGQASSELEVGVWWPGRSMAENAAEGSWPHLEARFL